MSFFITAHAWKSATHADIMEKGIEVLKNDGFADAYDFYYRYLAVMIASAQKPDRQGDIDKGRGFHYYNAKDVGGRKQKQSSAGYYRSGKNVFSSPAFSRSARTIFEDDYQLALSFFAMGGEQNTEKAMEYTARCVHMISDLCCTPHTTDLTLTSRYSSRHKRFEFRANDIFSMFTAAHGDKEIYEEYQRCETAGENFNLIAEISASFYDTVVHAEQGSALDSVIEQMLLLAHKHTAAFLLKLYNDIHTENDALVPSETYRLINAKHSAAFIAGSFCSGYAASPYMLDQVSSLVRFSVNTSGYYEICFAESGERVTLAKSKSTREKPYGFKIAKTPNGYRLLSSLSGFTKALAANIIGDVGMAVYDPDNKAHHWHIEKV